MNKFLLMTHQLWTPTYCSIKIMFILIIVLLFLSGCASVQEEDMLSFESRLKCDQSRQQIYDLTQEHIIDKFFCNPQPICPSDEFVAYYCWVQKNNSIIKMTFDKSDHLKSIVTSRSTGIKNIESDNEKYLCK